MAKHKVNKGGQQAKTKFVTEETEVEEVADTDDAEEAAVAANRAMIQGERVTITTEYDSPWDTGTRPEETPEAQEQAAKAQAKALEEPQARHAKKEA